MNDTKKIPLQDLRENVISDANKLKIKAALKSDIPKYLNDAEALEKQIAQVFDTNSTDVFPALTALLPDGIDERVKSHVTQVVIEYLDGIERGLYNANIPTLRGIFQGNLKDKVELADAEWLRESPQFTRPLVSVEAPSESNEEVHILLFLHLISQAQIY